MRPLSLGLALFLAAAAAAPLAAQQKRISPHETISAVIGSIVFVQRLLNWSA